MVQLSTLISLAAAAAASVMAAPMPSPAAEAMPAGWEIVPAEEVARIMTSSDKSPLQKRTPGGIYLCTGTNWSGTCGYAVQPFNQCIVLTSPWYHNIGSFGPDSGALVRLTTSAPSCTAHGDAFISSPGTGNLHNYNGVDVGSYITSFLVQQCTNC